MLTKKRLATWTILTFLSILGSFVVVRTTRGQTEQRAPFTAVVVENFYKYPSLQPASQVVTKFATKADGSNVKIREEALSDGTTNEIKGLIDVPSKTGATTEALTHSVTTVHYDDISIARYSKKPSACTADSPTESTEILGYTVLKSTHDAPVIAGVQRRTVSWVAPALDCYALKGTMFVSKDGGPLLPVTLTEVTSLAPGEPDPALFAIPSDRTERSPSEVFAERQRIKNEPRADCPKCVDRNATLDSIYREKHNLK